MGTRSVRRRPRANAARDRVARGPRPPLRGLERRPLPGHHLAGRTGPGRRSRLRPRRLGVRRHHAALERLGRRHAPHRALPHAPPAGGLYFLQTTRATFWLPPLVAPDPPAETAESGGPPETIDEATTDDTADAPAEPGLWQIRFTRTTPLFALEDSLVLDEAGSAVVETLATAPQGVSVAPGRLAALGQTLASNDFLQAHPADTRSGCVSCFHYLLEIRTPDGDQLIVETDDLGMSGTLLATVEQLVAALN